MARVVRGGRWPALPSRPTAAPRSCSCPAPGRCSRPPWAWWRGRARIAGWRCASGRVPATMGTAPIAGRRSPWSGAGSGRSSPPAPGTMPGAASTPRRSSRSPAKFDPVASTPLRSNRVLDQVISWLRLRDHLADVHNYRSGPLDRMLTVELRRRHRAAHTDGHRRGHWHADGVLVRDLLANDAGAYACAPLSWPLPFVSDAAIELEPALS